jgi:hypothetical protein
MFKRLAIPSQKVKEIESKILFNPPNVNKKCYLVLGHRMGEEAYHYHSQRTLRAKYFFQ